MAKNALAEIMKAKAKKPPSFADEGPPEQEEERGAGTEDEPGDAEDAGGADKGYGEHADVALEDLGDVLGVAPEDRADLKNALDAYVHACVADALKDGGGDEGEGEEPADEEEPSGDEE